MLKNYLKIAFRNIIHNKTVSLINIFGLAVSMSICLLIILFVYDQRSFDQFHQNKDSIYRLVTDYNSSSANTGSWYATSPAALADILKENYTGIKKAAHVRASFGGETKYTNEVILRMDGLFTEPDFLDIFDFELIKGDKSTALSEPGSVILTKSTAEKFFGDEDPMGKILTVLGDRNYRVTGLLDNAVRSHIEFDALASSSSLPINDSSQNWTRHMSYSYTYILLEENESPAGFADFFPSIIEIHFREIEQASITGFELQSLTRINLGRVLYNEIGTVIPAVAVYFLGAFVLIIILIASFNYITLLIARSIKRAKEVGVRKVLGAYRSNVMKQFIIESIVTVLIAMIFAFFLLRMLLPEFNSLYVITESKTQIQTNIETNLAILFIFLGFSIIIGFLAGLYPSIYLSRFKPASVLKGLSSTRGLSSGILRKIIIVSQFSFTIIFIISSILLFRQFNYMGQTEYGFDREHIVNVALLDVPYNRFREVMLQNPDVQEVTATSKIPALGSQNGMWIKSDSIPDRMRANSFEVDEHYLQVMNIDLISGRNFSEEFTSDQFGSVILNENAVGSLQLGTPVEAIGTPVQIEDETYQVIGVIENFISFSPLSIDDPVILLNNPDHFYYASIKTQPNQLTAFLPYLKETWYDLGSQYTVQFQVFDDQLKSNFIIAIFGDFIKMLTVITLFTIIISCLGLFGMAMNTAESRVKEIALRKTLGASIQNVTLLISKGYLVLIGIAAGIGGIIAWFLNSIWLQNISNSIEIDGVVFVMAILGTIMLALFTVGSQTIIAALANPVESLKSE